MKRSWAPLIGMAFFLIGAGTNVVCQEQATATRIFFGPVMGVEAEIIDPAAFNTTLQAVYPKTDGTYFPVVTEMGIESSQRIPLGDSKRSLLLHEMFLIAGLDQNMPVPNVDLLLGYRGPSGFEVGMGPHFSLTAPGGSVKIGASVMYWAGLTIATHGYTVPIKLTFVPMPSYVNPQIALLVGFSFEAAE